MKFLLIAVVFLLSLNIQAQEIDVKKSVSLLSTGPSFGTGFQIEVDSGEWYTVTNGHVCRDAKKQQYIHYTNRSLKKQGDIRVLSVDYGYDLCLLEPMQDVPPLRLANKIILGEAVTVYGHPLAGNLAVSTGFVGVFSVVEAVGDKTTIYSYSTEAKVDSGQSGSPIVNFKNEVVGVIFAMNTSTKKGQSVSFSNLKRFLQFR